MVKYFIKEIKPIKQSFLSMINSIEETYGNAKAPYDFKLTRVSFFGLIKKDITKSFYFDKSYNPALKIKIGSEIKIN